MFDFIRLQSIKRFTLCYSKIDEHVLFFFDFSKIESRSFISLQSTAIGRFFGGNLTLSISFCSNLQQFCSQIRGGHNPNCQKIKMPKHKFRHSVASAKSTTGAGAAGLNHYAITFAGQQRNRAVFIEKPFA